MCAVEEQQEWHSAPGPSSSTSVLVSDLLPSTEYQFNVMAQNRQGSGPFSDITTARTMGQDQLSLLILTSYRFFLSLSWSHLSILHSEFRHLDSAACTVSFLFCFHSRRIIQAGAAHAAILQPQL